MYLRLFLIFFILLIVYLVIRTFDIIKRKKEKKVDDLQLLKPRKTGVLKEFEMSDPDVFVQILNVLEEQKPKMIRSSKEEAMIYLDTGKAKNEGMLMTPDKQMPVRIILKKKHKKLIVQIDEDYRQPMLVKTGKKILNEK